MKKQEEIFNAIFSYLREKQGERFTLRKILLDINIEVDDNTFQYIEARLSESEYVDPKIISGPRKIFSINDKGIIFINDGGFPVSPDFKS